MAEGTGGASAGGAEAGLPVVTRRALRREEARAAEQVSGGLRPVLDGAAALTDGALSSPDGPRVANHFDVQVVLGASQGGVDPEALRAALIELLREAARRHGMEVG
jgi:hypothetical protein